MLELESELIDILLALSRDRKIFWFKFGISFRAQFNDCQWWLLSSRKLFVRKVDDKSWLLIEGLPGLKNLAEEVGQIIKKRRLEYRGWSRKNIEVVPVLPTEKELTDRKNRIEEIMDAAVS
ncbi:MAG: hypothetical protein HYX21_01495 [Candidatus Yanofskybacteria bacterium]|nr:hypothetical protein [Candidatus Yanofskybacteria bacterium]